MFDRVNIRDPSFGGADPNSRDKSEIVMGYTHESPSPARQALNTTPRSPWDKTRPAMPAHATSNPACTNRISSTVRNSSGASHLPSMSAAWWYSKPLNWCCQAPGPLIVRSPLARKLFWCAYWFGSGGSSGFPLNHQFSGFEEHTSELQSLRHLVCRLL